MKAFAIKLAQHDINIPDGYELRHTTSDDFDKAVNLAKEYFGNSQKTNRPTASEFLQAIHAGTCSHITYNGKMVAIAGYDIFSAGEIALCVHENHRRKGIGTELLKHCANTMLGHKHDFAVCQTENDGFIESLRTCFPIILSE